MSIDVTRLNKIIEGKTKIIYQHEDPKHIIDHIYSYSKDDITAFDGKRHDVIEGKGISCNTITCNVFKLLYRNNIPNHFIRVVDNRTFLANRLSMMWTEVVTRRVVTGSYCQRYPEIQKGIMLKKPAVEFFLKDDKRHDPLMILGSCSDDTITLVNAHKPLSNKSVVGEINPRDFGDLGIPNSQKILDVFGVMKDLALKTFLVIEKAAMRTGCILQDMKVEFGWDQYGQIRIGDVIDNESWRLCRIDEETGKLIEMSKQVYRDLPEVTPEGLEVVRENYEWVAEATKAF